MRILGIDPGLATVGYSLVDVQGNKFSVIDYGIIRTTTDCEDIKRLQLIYKQLKGLIKDFKPEQMAVEELFFNKNAKTAIRVGQARGVILLCGAEADLEVAEYTPLQIKQAVVGYGRAEKNQVQEMVKILLNLKKIPESDDAADALAVSICHGHCYGSRKKWRQIR